MLSVKATAETAAGAEAAAAGAAAFGVAEAFSTSALTMRPCGPEPLSWLRSSPLSAAMRRASGEAKTRLPSATGAAGAGVAAAAMGEQQLPDIGLGIAV